MTITSKVKMDLSLKGFPPVVNAVQEDKYSRNIEISLYERGIEWEPPAGTKVIVRYKKPDGKGGNYDVLPDGTVAYEINGNSLIIALAPQVCTVPGIVKLSVGLIDGNSEVNTFSINIDVQNNPGVNVESEDYDNLSGFSGPIYDLDLRDSVTVDYPAEHEVEQRFTVTENVDYNKLMAAIEAGQAVRVRYRSKFMLSTSMDMSEILTEEAAQDNRRILCGIGIDVTYMAANVMDYYFTRLYVGTDDNGVQYVTFSFTPASISYELSLLVPKAGWNPGKYLGTDEEGNVVEKDAPEGGGATVDEVLDAIPTVTNVAVTENADGSVTMVNTLSDGSTETIVVTADAEGNPNGLTVNGTAIPLTWTEVTA